MALSEYQQFSLDEFQGAWLRPEAADVPPSQALLSLNCEFNPGQCSTRRGFKAASGSWNTFNCRSLLNWVTSGGDYLVGLADTGSGPKQIVVQDLLGGSTSLSTSSGWTNPVGAVFSIGGGRVYAAGYTADTVGAGQGLVITTSAASKLFMGPLTDKPSLGTTSGSYNSAGAHRVGYIIESTSGFVGKISPVSSSTGLFDASSTITVTAGQAITFSLTKTWPTGSMQVYPVMTTADNQAVFYLVPGVDPVAVTAGVNSTVTFTLDIADSDLAATGTDVTLNNLFFTQDSGGSGPFSPFSVAAFGTRNVYLTEIDGVSQAYASEPDNAEQITADQHVLYLPGQRRMTAQGSLGQTLYILGPNWTFSFNDTGDVPVTWPAARLVDGKIGTLSPHGFTVDASTGIGWCAHSSGLYLFQGGAYEQMPVSYMVDPDWKRINFAKGSNSTKTAGWNGLRVVDDKDKQRVYVIAPLSCNGTCNTSGTAVTWVSGDPFPTSLVANGTSNFGVTTTVTINGSGYTLSSVTDSTHLTLTGSAGTQTGVAFSFTPDYPTHILVFDYSNGSTYDKVKYSLWVIKGVAPGAGLIVQNPTTGISEFWVGQFAASSPVMTRQMNTKDDAAPFADLVTGGIDWQYEPALLPGLQGSISRIFHHYAQELRVTGNGTLHRTLYGLDRTKSQAITDVTLSATPGQAITNRFPRLRSESASTRFTMNAANEYCVLSTLTHFFAPGPERR